MVLLDDDGLATGYTTSLATQTVRRAQPANVIVAVPVADPETRQELAVNVDEMVCLSAPQSFYAVGQWYEDFGQTSDEEVTSLLQEAQRARRRLATDSNSHPNSG